MNVVPRTATPLGEPELAAILRDAHAHVFGAPPSLARLGVGWAQVALEHARGKAIWNCNIGNVTTGADYAGDVYELTTQERIKRDPDVWETRTLRYVAFPHWLDGAAHYWDLLRRRYESVLLLFDAGEAKGAAIRLSELHYYTARAEPYAAALASLAAEFNRRIVPLLVGTEPAPRLPLPITDEEHLALVEACAGANDCGARELAA